MYHGLTKTSEYNIWRQMRQRCNNPTAYYYKFYGARGIKVCKRWDNSFTDFLSDMGNKPTKLHTLDRINNDADYEPSNCKWATRKEQANNRRDSRRINHNGKSLFLYQWSKELGIPLGTLAQRKNKGWLPEKMFSKEDFRKR